LAKSKNDVAEITVSSSGKVLKYQMSSKFCRKLFIY